MKEHELGTLIDDMSDVVRAISPLVYYGGMDKSEACHIIEGMMMLAVKEHDICLSLEKKITFGLYEFLDRLLEIMPYAIEGDYDI